MDIDSPSETRCFPALVQRIAIHPDYEGFIFRKFGRLSARNLLHLESRLAYLEWKLDQADELATRGGNNETLRSIRVREAFEENSKDLAHGDCARMKLAEEIREILKEYPLVGPKKRALEAMTGQPYHNICGPHATEQRRGPVLAGLAGKRLEPRNHLDLIAVSTFTAALLVGAIVLLCFVDQEWQLGVIAVCMVFFVSAVAALTTARRVEVFVSTAAYAAVLVVFVSSPPLGSGAAGCPCASTVCPEALRSLAKEGMPWEMQKLRPLMVWDGIGQHVQKRLSVSAASGTSDPPQKDAAQVVSITTQSGLGLAAYVPSGGASLAFCPIRGRRLYVNSKRRVVIKALMRERGWKGHHFGAKDIAVGAGSVLVTALAVAVDPLVHNVADHAVQHMHHRADAAQKGAGSSAGVGTEAIPVAWVEGAVHKIADLATHQAMNKGTLRILTEDEGVEEE
ncbi:hypothetical protein B0T18DRAFT_390214 [Schizothecium vesticola]|uniref:DUF6594 domain-containing protein n=1 Tax=Schizothecium vesticola TaxID=314040 RepID=A0AA40K4I3_9PEZI|nr:hypothetical protein B0T18DRAFT_390214 [Schizothecium vesticola]